MNTVHLFVWFFSVLVLILWADIVAFTMLSVLCFLHW